MNELKGKQSDPNGEGIVIAKNLGVGEERKEIRSDL